jgi:hypothetical protein
MADFLYRLAEQSAELRAAMDDAFLEMQTDEPPEGDRFQMFQAVRDALKTLGNEETEAVPRDDEDLSVEQDESDDCEGTWDADELGGA